MFDHDCYEELDAKDSLWVWIVTVIVLAFAVACLLFVFLEDGNNVSSNCETEKSVEKLH